MSDSLLFTVANLKQMMTGPQSIRTRLMHSMTYWTTGSAVTRQSGKKNDTVANVPKMWSSDDNVHRIHTMPGVWIQIPGTDNNCHNRNIDQG